MKFIGVVFSRALSGMLHSPRVFLLAALIAFLGVPGPADLLTIYHVLPPPTFSANDAVLSIPLLRSGLLPAALFGLLVWAWLSIALVILSGPYRPGQSDDLAGVLSASLSSLPRAAWSLGFVAILIGLLGIMLSFLLLLPVGVLVQFFPVLDPLRGYVTILTAVLGLLVMVILAPFVLRAVLFEEISANDAINRALNIVQCRLWPVLGLVLLSLVLDIIKGPLAALAGLVTNGWMSVLALVFGPSLNPPIAGGVAIASLALFVLSTVIVAFQAMAFSQLYLLLLPQARRQ